MCCFLNLLKPRRIYLEIVEKTDFRILLVSYSLQHAEVGNYNLNYIQDKF